MRERFKEKWSRVPSGDLTASLRSEAQKYQTILNNAVQADHVVKEKYQQCRPYILLLSKSEVSECLRVCVCVCVCVGL